MSVETIIGGPTPSTKNSIQLSLCILSYNQPDEMRRLLSGLSLEDLCGVEILMRDDSTNTLTKDLIENEFRHLNIKYVRGQKEGIDRTIIFLTNLASGRYIWWLGDDEIINNGVFQIKCIIKSNPDIGFIWANYQMADSLLKAAYLGQDKILKRSDDLISMVGAGLGFISSTVMKRELALQALNGAERYAGSEFSNLYIVLSVLSRTTNPYFASGPIIRCHPHQPQSLREMKVNSHGGIQNKAFEVFGINYVSILKDPAFSFDRKIISRECRKSFNQAWKGVVVGTVGGWDTTKGKRLILLRHFWMFPEAYLAIILFSLPRWSIIVLFKCYKIVKFES